MLRKRGANSPPSVDMDDVQHDDNEESVPIPVLGRKFEKQSSFVASDFALPVPSEKLRKKYGLFSNGKTGPKPTPVIVVTDIGADIDDTLALFVLLGAMDAVKIVAIVTSVNNGLHRGAVTRGFLRLLGVSDESVEILPSVDGCVADCYIPESFPAAKEAALGELSQTPRRIVEICKEHIDTGVFLFGIASLSPIAAAIELDQREEGIMKQSIKRVYLQGNCFAKTEESDECSDTARFRGQYVRISPNPLAYNFKNDMIAARTVFNCFQDLVPFTILGKFAAYKVPVRKGDFTDWTRKINAAWKVTYTKSPQEVDVPNPTDLLVTAKRQMKRFRSMNPVKFDSIYNVPKQLTPLELEKFEWFDDLPRDFVCCHPYDPLIGLRMIEDIRKIQAASNTNERNDDDFVMKDNGQRRLFKEYRVQNKNGHYHVILGNIPSQHSIPDAEHVHDVLVEHISKGLSYHGDSEWLN